MNPQIFSCWKTFSSEMHQIVQAYCLKFIDYFLIRIGTSKDYINWTWCHINNFNVFKCETSPWPLIILFMWRISGFTTNNFYNRPNVWPQHVISWTYPKKIVVYTNCFPPFALFSIYVRMKIWGQQILQHICCTLSTLRVSPSFTTKNSQFISSSILGLFM
jgi:hypothetical protein